MIDNVFQCPSIISLSIRHVVSDFSQLNQGIAELMLVSPVEGPGESGSCMLVLPVK
jgi:hypothetical protein